MDRESVRAAFRAFDMKIARNTGLVTGPDDLNYGVLAAENFRTLDGTYIQFDDLDVESGEGAISFREIEHTLSFFHADGRVETAEGSRLTDDDREVISLSKMPVTIAELNAVIDSIYPQIDSQLYYDALREREMIDMAMFDRPREGVLAVTDKIMSVYYENLEIKLAEHGFLGKPPAYIVRDKIIDIRTYKNVKNPFRDWVESHEWDGVPRMRMWFRDTFGATAPPLRDLGDDVEERYLGDVTEAWFLGAIKRMYSETRHEIVPVLIGDQGIGKGLALKYTAGQDCWHIETNANVSEPTKFLEGIRGSVIVEMSESKQLKGDIDDLKTFVSMSSDQLRTPYARYEVRRPRHFVFIATSNYDNIFIDVTGNRRFFPMYCDPRIATREFCPEDRSVGQYDVEQVWAEAREMYMRDMRGEESHKWYLTAEMAEIAEVMQSYGTKETRNVDKINTFLDDPMNGYDEVGARIAKEMIMEQVFGVLPKETVGRNESTAFNNWANTKGCWVKIGRTTRIGGKIYGSAYERVCPPGQIRKTVRLKTVKPKRGASNDPVTIVRERAQRYGFHETGDVFPIDGLDDATVQLLLSEGYIYNSGMPSKPDYRLGYLP